MSTKRKAESLLRAVNQPGIMKGGGSHADLERDSGFSDASSEHLSPMDTTDSEDSPQPAAQRAAQHAGSGPKPFQLAVVGGSYSGISPMIIMNNVVLKQPVETPRPPLKRWGFNTPVEVVQPVVRQPQVVFLQPVVSRQASHSSKQVASKHRRSKKYLPILKSYPKIAPHPGEGGGSLGWGTGPSSSSSSSSLSGSEKCSSLTHNVWEQCQREKVQRSLCGSTSNSGAASPSLPATPCSISPLLHSGLPLPAAETAPGVSPATERPLSAISLPASTASLGSLDSISSLECSSGDGGSDAKRKRFCNTYNILSQSGLLDITLRTKELLRQNQSTQSDLDRLRIHTDLFLHNLQTGDASVCMKMLTSLQEEDRERAAQRPESREHLDGRSAAIH